MTAGLRKDTISVVRITRNAANAFVSEKHYLRRLGVFHEGFGLIIDGFLEGVVVYGLPSAAVNRHAFIDRDFRLYELTRLVIQTDIKNAASYLVGRSLKMLRDRPCAVVSYADTSQGHCGIVYQATNWLYTGSTVSHDCLYVVEGEKLHPKTIQDRFGVSNPKEWAKMNNIRTVKPGAKHRYFTFVGSRKEIKRMIGKLRYKAIHKYPKMDYKTYYDGKLLSIHELSCTDSGLSIGGDVL